MKNLSAVLSRYAKFIAAIVGAVTEAINLNLLPHAAQNYVSVAVSILTALGVAGLTNGPSPDLVGAVTDIAALKAEIEPIRKAGGIHGLVQWVEDSAASVEATALNFKDHVEALAHGKPAVTVPEPPSTEGAPVTVTTIQQDPSAKAGASVPMNEPVLEPVSEPPTPGADAVTELAAQLAKTP